MTLCTPTTFLVVQALFLLPWIGLPTGADDELDDGSDPAEVSSQESRLIRHILARYNRTGKYARPVLDSRDIVTLEFGIRLVHLDLDEKEQVMTASVWTRMRWYDEILTWYPNDYDGITTIVIPAEKIWTPDIVLVNTAVTALNEQSADVLVRYNGQVFWAPQRKYSSACLIDVTEYPYDKHTCDMWFQSMSNPSSNINITAYPQSPLDLDTYLTSYKHAQQWAILENVTRWHQRPRDVGMALMWSRRAALQFSLTVQRRPGFMGLLLIIPCTLMSFLVPLIFCFPPERPDRHTLAMSLFASLTILLFMVTEQAPPTASFVPRLALYYCFNLLVLLMATCCSAIVVNLSKRGETREKVPKVVRLVFIRGLGRLLCFGERLKHLTEVRRASRRLRAPKKARHSGRSHSEMEADVTPHNGGAAPPVPQSYPAQYIQESSTDGESRDNHLLALMSRKLCDIEKQLVHQREPRDPENEMPDISIPVDIKLEWRTLSMVLDRLFFFAFLIIDCVSLGVFHPRLP